MVLTAFGQLSLNEINVEKGGGHGTQCDLNSLEASGINQLSALRPNGFTPNSVDEWYSYNHTASTTTSTTTSSTTTSSTTTTTLPPTSTTTSTTTTSSTTTTTTQPEQIEVTWNYSTGCSTAVHGFEVWKDVGAGFVQEVNVGTTQGGTFDVPVMSKVYAVCTVKLSSDCDGQGGSCNPQIDEGGSYSGSFTATCPEVISTQRTLTTGQVITYTASEDGEA